MIKNILAIIIYFLSAHTIFGQDENLLNKNTIGFGVGYTNYTIYGSQVDLEASFPGSDSYVERKQGIRINIEFRQMLNQHFFLQEGLSFVQKGGYHRLSGFTDPARAEINYLQIPILAGLGTGNNKFYIGILGGFAANMTMSSDNTTTGSGWFNDTYNKNYIIISYILGGFIDIGISEKMAFSASLNYDNDISRLMERSLSEKEYYLKLKGFSVSVGVRFIMPTKNNEN